MLTPPSSSKPPTHTITARLVAILCIYNVRMVSEQASRWKIVMYAWKEIDNSWKEIETLVTPSILAVCAAVLSAISTDQHQNGKMNRNEKNLEANYSNHGIIAATDAPPIWPQHFPIHITHGRLLHTLLQPYGLVWFNVSKSLQVNTLDRAHTLILIWHGVLLLQQIHQDDTQ